MCNPVSSRFWRSFVGTYKRFSRSSFVVAFAVSTIFASVVAPSGAWAEVPAPTFSGRMLASNGGAELTVVLPSTLQSSTARASLAVIVTREVNGKQNAIAMFSKPNVTTVFIDRAALSGNAYRYKAAVLTTSGGAGWSPVITVSGAGVPSSPTPTPTPKPTATPKPPAPAPSPTPTPVPTQVPSVGLSCHDIALPKGITDCIPGFEEEVIRMTNVERANIGVKPVTGNRQLNCAARRNLIYLVQNNLFSHTGWDRYIRESGYAGSPMNQNLAQGYTHPTTVMFAWMHSTGHRAAIQSSSNKEIGVSCLIGPGYSTWWIQDYGAQN